MDSRCSGAEVLSSAQPAGGAVAQQGAAAPPFRARSPQPSPLFIPCLALALLAACAGAQQPATNVGLISADSAARLTDTALARLPLPSDSAFPDSTRRTVIEEPPAPPRYASAADSIASTASLAQSMRDAGLHVVVSLYDRELWVVRGADTLLAAPAAVAMGTSLEYGGRVWTFTTPRGRHTVLAKRKNPTWVPPDWHYAEVAKQYNLLLERMPRDRPVVLSDGSRLEIRGGVVGIVPPDSTFDPLPTDEEIVFDSTIFIPPVGTKNRQILGELGRYQLDLGNGYLIHGTPDESTIGDPVTHGCVRLRDDDITWLWEHVPVHTPVYVY